MGYDEIYDGDDLGAVYGRERTAFRLWSPAADEVRLALYRDGAEGEAFACLDMARDVGGTWRTEVAGDLKNTYYSYIVRIDGKERESGDPYARAAGVNGVRSMVLGDIAPAAGGRGLPRDLPHAIVTEVSIRDLTADPDCGIPEPHRGRFLGLTHRGCVSESGLPAGLDYIKSLGVTHVQLMPFYDFGSVDEAGDFERQYNWGYDPVNYNVPEGSYATDPYNGEVRVRECREMIGAIHEAGLGVIMDVVYNHVFDAESSVFHRCAPGYFFRMSAQEGGMRYGNATGCGNEIASERPMVRKYIIDSMTYWAREYGIDGFRMDLMGVLDTETVRALRLALDRVRPGILLYGEGWAAGDSPLPAAQRALKSNAMEMDFPERVGMFSDDIRDCVKGSVFDAGGRGFVNGCPVQSRWLGCCVSGGIALEPDKTKEYGLQERAEETDAGIRPWAKSPAQAVNYLSCHDNLTLWDKLTLSAPEASEEERLAMNRLGAAVIFTAQGMPFFLCGEESGRSKPDGRGSLSGNSYDLPVEINRMDWHRMKEFQQLADYYRGLIAFRRAFPQFWKAGAQQVRESLHLEEVREGVLAFTVEGGAKRAFVVYNALRDEIEQPLPAGDWQVLVTAERAGARVLYEVSGRVRVSPCSCLAAVQSVDLLM